MLIKEVVSEIVIQPKVPAGGGSEAAAPNVASDAVDEDAIVRRATERVVEILRREWQ